jgi:hypothetical protein
MTGAGQGRAGDPASPHKLAAVVWPTFLNPTPRRLARHHFRASLLGDWGFYMLPKLLYELMPVFYVSVGFAAALLLYNSYAILSEIVLLIAALMILIHAFRKPHRSDRALRAPAYSEEEAKLGSSVSNPSSNNSISPFAWRLVRLEVLP